VANLGYEWCSSHHQRGGAADRVPFAAGAMAAYYLKQW